VFLCHFVLSTVFSCIFINFVSHSPLSHYCDMDRNILKWSKQPKWHKYFKLINDFWTFLCLFWFFSGIFRYFRHFHIFVYFQQSKIFFEDFLTKKCNRIRHRIRQFEEFSNRCVVPLFNGLRGAICIGSHSLATFLCDRYCDRTLQMGLPMGTTKP